MAQFQGRFGLMLTTVVMLTTLVMFNAAPAFASEYMAGSIKILQPWTRQTPAAAKVAGGFMTLVNTGTSADRLIGGTIDNAARFEVHEMSVAEGVMRMRQLQSGLEIKPGATVVLKPGSYHVMFLDLRSAPAAGKRLKGTLVFEKAGTIDVEYEVEPAGASTSRGSGHGGAATTGHGSGSGSGSGAMKNGNQ